MNFEELEIDERILHAVRDMGFEAMTPIQRKAIPAALEGGDLIGQAQTGTGKTAAYGIPALLKVDPELKKPQVLILCPTRELAIQVAGEVRGLAKYLHDVKVLPVYGGQDMQTQIRAVKSGVQIIVGTPGRVMDHMRRKTIKMGHVGMVVLDEADEMLNMGFREDIETILEKIPQERQLVMFSATMSEAIRQIASRYQEDALHIKIKKKELTVENIHQYYCEVKERDKAEVLARFLEKLQPHLSVVFCNTKKRVDELVDELRRRGCQVQGLHGDLKQAQRDKVMKAFRENATRVLVATDVAARGIDVDDVDVIFNYDLPQDDEYYVHRIGRTGRAGRSGSSYSLVSRKDYMRMRQIERYCKTTVEKIRIPSLQEVKEGQIGRIFAEGEETYCELQEEKEMQELLTVMEQKMKESRLDEHQLVLALAARFLENGVDVGKQPVAEWVDFSKERHERGGRKVRERRDMSGRKNGARKGHRREEGMTRLYLGIGKRRKVGVKDIVGAIASECRIPGRLIGAIDIYEDYSHVDIPDEEVKHVIKKMKNARICGKKVRIDIV